MTRQEYMQQLAALLAAMPEAERRDALDYYEEYFDAAGPEKEAQPILELGSPQNVAEKIWEGTGAQSGTPMPDNSMPEQGSRRRKSPVWIVLAILAILIVVLLVFIGSFKIEIGILLSCPIKNRLYFQSPNDILFLGFKNRFVRNFRTGIS